MDLLLDATRSQQTGLVLVTHDIQYATATDRQLRLSEGQLAPLVPEGRAR